MEIKLFNHLGNGGSFTLNGNKTISVSVDRVYTLVYNSENWNNNLNASQSYTYGGVAPRHTIYCSSSQNSLGTQLTTSSNATLYIPESTPYIHSTSTQLYKSSSWEVRYNVSTTGMSIKGNNVISGYHTYLITENATMTATCSVRSVSSSSGGGSGD